MLWRRIRSVVERGASRSAWCSRCARAHGEEGFTLIELMIVLVILPLVIGGVSIAIITSLKDSNGVSGKVSDSSSTQITSASYVRDVQSAASITTTASASSPPPCGSGTVFVLGLSWAGTVGNTVVSYWEGPTSGDLVRIACTNGSPTPTGTDIVAHGLSPSSVTAAITPPGEAIKAAAGWTATAGISSVILGALESASAFNFDLLASPRSWTPASGGVEGGGTPTPPPLVLLGSASPSPVLTCSGNGQIDVSGTVAMNPTGNGSATLSGNADLTATQIYTADQANPSNAISTSGNATYSPSGTPSSGPAIPDPYQSLVGPSTTGPPVYTDGNYHGPGVYQNTLSLSGQANVTLASGTYVLENGISLSGQATLTSASGGVFFYVTGGSINLSGNGKVTLEPMSSPPAPAPDLLIWQVSGDHQALGLSGNGSGNLFDGAIYAPGAQVGGTGNASLKVGSVVAESIACSGNGTTTVG
ncbi:MAG: prepilin-type N-terminal cleavage/methylation domain-containing protein [Acidimicrobiales bacterium]